MIKLNNLLIGILLICLLGCKTDNNSQSINNKTDYERILENGKLRVGYISYPPSYIVNSDGSHSGIFYEVMEKVGENLGLEVEYAQEVTWDGMIQDIKNDKIDLVVTGIWPTSQRGKHVDFVNPLFYSVVKAYTSADNNLYDNNLEAMNQENVRISTIDGEMTQIIASSDFPKAKQVSVTQLTGVSQTLLDIKSKKADITFVEPSIALEFMEKNPNSIKEVVGIEPLRVFPNCMMIPKNQNDLKSTLNIALEELINTGFIDKVIDKYEKFPNSYYRVQLPYRN
jgi:ABC-type amino acid transport substrate-binding protein